jgi:hypothetical protein
MLGTNQAHFFPSRPMALSPTRPKWFAHRVNLSYFFSFFLLVQLRNLFLNTKKIHTNMISINFFIFFLDDCLCGFCPTGLFFWNEHSARAREVKFWASICHGRCIRRENLVNYDFSLLCVHRNLRTKILVPWGGAQGHRHTGVYLEFIFWFIFFFFPTYRCIFIYLLFQTINNKIIFIYFTYILIYLTC